MQKLPILLCVLAFASPLTAQQRVAVDSIPADSADVATIDGVMRAFYESISGPAGQPRQWARDRSLYTPEMRFTALSVREGQPIQRTTTHQEFVDLNDAWLVEHGFYEEEIHREVRRFGNMATVWSTYVMRETPDGPATGRGINALQLFWDGTRWWVKSVIWDDERPDNPIPRTWGGGRAETHE